MLQRIFLHVVGLSVFCNKDTTRALHTGDVACHLSSCLIGAPPGTIVAPILSLPFTHERKPPSLYNRQGEYHLPKAVHSVSDTTPLYQPSGIVDPESTPSKHTQSL